MAESLKFLDEHLRLRLTDLSPRRFELFFLDFLNSGISLTIERHGRPVTKRIISATTYASGSGHKQDGIDLHATVEGGEIWAFQCKREKEWTLVKTRNVIEATAFKANHYFLVVAASDPPKAVYDEMLQHPEWTFWNLDRICSELKLRVAQSEYLRILSFLSPEELKRFVPFATDALIRPEKFFERFLGEGKLLRHDWKLVGRAVELQALHNFLAGTDKVQVLIAKGGAGKTRLLRELCLRLRKEAPEVEILFLNPHRTGDLSFPFIDDAAQRLVIVDDAHRIEQVPLSLLALVRQDVKSKIILSARPQGAEALASKLYDAGLGDAVAPQLSLSALKPSDVKALCHEVLGENLRNYAEPLAERTADSPFLAVVAAELLRSGRMEWGNWASRQEFRQHVFREFEQTNLESVPAPDRNSFSGLIRLLALIAPAAMDSSFSEKAARTLELSAFELETQLNRLRQTELVAGREEGLRVVPDLFADFLAYETCYGQNKVPAFVNKIVTEFSNATPALLRNLSEATWIARANAVTDDQLLNTVLQPELKRFETASFYRRAEMLKHWTSFCVFLPDETLQLAGLALRLRTAPKEQDQWSIFALDHFDSHEYVLQQIPLLLRPVATYHEQHRYRALDMLWDLGREPAWPKILGDNQNHPWSTIAKIIKYEPRKPVGVTLSALEWLRTIIAKPESLAILEGDTPILRTILSPCFERFVEFTEFEGREFRWWQREVDVKKTETIREGALRILRKVIEEGSWRAALDALSALERAIHRAAPVETKQVQDETKFRDEWRPERLKALVIYEQAIAKHTNVAVRYEIRQTLKRNLAYEEDSSFAEHCKKVLASIPDDLSLQTAVVILSQGAFEFEDLVSAGRGPELHERATQAWNERVRGTASKLVEAYPEAPALFDFLNSLADELILAGNHVFFAPLFEEFAKNAPAVATALASHVLQRDGGHLAREWPALVEKNPQIDEVRRIEFLTKAAASQVPGATVAFIRAVSRRMRQNQPLSDAEKDLLLEIASKANADETYHLLDVVEWSSEANLPWAFEIFRRLPIRDAAPHRLKQVLEALVPYQPRKSEPPRELVQHILRQLVQVPELDLFNHSREWEALTEKYPREVYELVRERILLRASAQAPPEYRPVPHGYHDRLDLAALVRDPDCRAICDELWKRVSDPNEPEHYSWIQLFQAVVLADATAWLVRMKDAIERAPTEDALFQLVELIKFEGSLIIFRHPEITRLFLQRALGIGGDPLLRRMHVRLHSSAGPQVRSYSGGTLDQELDYIEAKAFEAAEKHASDDLLGVFYRWIVEIERKDRLIQKMRAQSVVEGLE